MNLPNTSHMNPFQEMKLFYSHVFRGLHKVKWLEVFSATLVGYIGAFVVLILSLRLLDGYWDWRNNAIRAAIVAILVGANIALQAAMRQAAVTIQEDLLSKQVDIREGDK